MQAPKSLRKTEISDRQMAADGKKVAELNQSFA